MIYTSHTQNISKGIKFVLGIGSAFRSRYQKIHHPKRLQRKQTHNCTGTQPTRHMPLTIVALWHMRWLQHCVLPCPVMIFWSTWTTACLEKQRVTMYSPWKFPKVLILIYFQLNLIESQSMLESDSGVLPLDGLSLSFVISVFGIIMYHLGKTTDFPVLLWQIHKHLQCYLPLRSFFTCRDGCLGRCSTWSL